jgi:hypothetical protein
MVVGALQDRVVLAWATVDSGTMLLQLEEQRTRYRDVDVDVDVDCIFERNSMQESQALERPRIENSNQDGAEK